MNDTRIKSALVLGLLLCLGLSLLGWTLGSALIRFKEYERTVAVKGLAEREVPADIALWPIEYTAASRELPALYAKLDSDTQQVVAFLQAAGFTAEEITVAAPQVVDKLAQRYGGETHVELRYTGAQTVTVYSGKVELVRATERLLGELGKKGVTVGGEHFQPTQYLFTGLNDLKPAMIEEATRKAREVGEKFAADSGSKLGRIRNANQGQFSIDDRDANTPHIKKVRVVSTVEYYLAD